jgi:hypothetical protein
VCAANCTCQHNGVIDTVAIQQYAHTRHLMPSYTDCPFGSKDVDAGSSPSRIQCHFPAFHGSPDASVTPGLEGAPCPHPSVSSFNYVLEKIPCYARYGYSCVNGRCINKCNTVPQRPTCTLGRMCFVNGAVGVCAIDKDAVWRCFNPVSTACKIDNDCPDGQSCNNCTCVSDTANGYGDRCNFFRHAETFSRIEGCMSSGLFGTTCASIGDRCNPDYALALVTTNSTIRQKIWQDVSSTDADGFGDCKLSMSMSQWCKRNW